MAGDLKISSEKPASKQDVLVMHLSGWLDQTSEEQLIAAVRTALHQGSRFLVLELSGVEMLTSAGVRALQRAHKLMTPETGTAPAQSLKLCNAPPHVYHVLKLTGLLQIIPNYESAQTAIDSFGS